MDVLQLLFNNFWLVVIFLAIFGGSIWAAIKWIIEQVLKHRERLQELRNEELRLQLQIMQKSEQEMKRPLSSSQPTPKEASREEREKAAYESGYQQQQSS